MEDNAKKALAAEEAKFNRIISQLRNLIDLRYDETNVESSNGIPTEIGILKDLIRGFPKIKQPQII